jgi:hypothetical protein
MNRITVVSTVTLAAPLNGPPLDAGVPTIVDGSDPYIQGLLEGKYLSEVDTPAEAVAETSTAPNMQWSREELVDYAENRRGITVPEGAKKAEIIEMIEQTEQAGAPAP